jgi:segregation and condensation protein A
LDLLLHLCRRREIPLLELRLAEVTAQFLAYLDVMQELEIEVAGEFVETAALLCLLKSREMLPQQESALDGADAAADAATGSDRDGSDGEDPRALLVARLLEYRRFREAAQDLLRQPRPGLDWFGRGMDARAFAGIEAEEPVGAAVQGELTELLSALCLRMEQLRREPPLHAVEAPLLPLESRMDEILRDLAATPHTDYEALVLASGRPDRAGRVVTLLALLEMARARLLDLLQRNFLGSIRVRRVTHSPSRAPEPPRAA